MGPHSLIVVYMDPLGKKCSLTRFNYEEKPVKSVFGASQDKSLLSLQLSHIELLTTGGALDSRDM